MTNEGITSSALVKAEDPDFGNSVIKELGSQTGSNPTLGIQPVATQVETPVLADTNTIQIDCKKLYVSWPKPTQSVVLYYKRVESAKRVREKWDNGTYKIFKKTVPCGMVMFDKGTMIPLKAWTIRLNGVPITATEFDVQQSIRYHPDKPDGIYMADPTYSAKTEEFSSMIRPLFTQIGVVESWELVPDTIGDHMKASVRFRNEEDAGEAARRLNMVDLPFHRLSLSKLAVQLVYTAKFKVAENIFQGIQPQLTSEVTRWKTSDLRFITLENSNPTRWYRVLKIEGGAAKDVADSINTITEIISGVVARECSSALWHPEFRKNGPLSRQLEMLGTGSKVVIVRDRAKLQVRLYGPREKCEKVQQDVIDLLKHERQKGSISKETSASTRNSRDCCVCWSEAENPIQTQCAHIYCADCFENMCTSATTKETFAKICCVGEAGTCLKTLSLSELQEHLLSIAFEELLGRSLTSYIRHHPLALRYCPSVDCGYIYRVTETRNMRTCPRCLVPVCTACHSQHGNMTCADWEDISTGRLVAFERLKIQIGIKDCPKCRTPLEKTEGCNHMICQCGAHICWVCLGVFEESDLCYEYMLREHNGIGLGLEEFEEMDD
ncbi:hypothetical protein F5B19DRAFT_501755 [Rostrohypoxylon terebratum]|nr:hypothetical protein F5B19DRAFT_501755 [Rostrohypoxylon terebratum]